ncbi:cyclic AMP-dependent transcription factor ATF-6 alpha isoform X2 [Amblyraja radiata]|uniref:cyclic AMP-dependent transcription factor ATF-6 alpha isoform X2 n=1 Tax=Amblyraja radiata TaxID=386614 RepID=UPI001401DFB1|nr:cyclic AMP-dependent transcription factor ATF-6 alpha isoform X2 [Amblyraja radiata]
MATDFSERMNPSICEIGSMSRDRDRDRDWESLLFEELNETSNMFEALKNNPFDMNMDVDFSLEFMSWDYDPWGPTCSSSPDEQMKSEPQSPASNYSVPSPADSTLQHDELLFTSSPQSSPSSTCSSTAQELNVQCSPETKHSILEQVNVPSNTSKQKPIQPKPIFIPALPVSQSSPVLSGKTIIIKPIQNVMSILKKQPIRIYPAPAGHPVVVSQPTVVQLQPQGILNSHPVINVDGGTSPVGTMPVRILTPANSSIMNEKVSVTNAIISTGINNKKQDVNALRRQERMIKNRESACLSRRKKKEYLLNLEHRLKSALVENAKLKNENGSLQKQLQDLMSENQQLKVTAPRRRAACVMALLVFMALSYGPASIWDSDSSALQTTVSSTIHNRHLLGFSDESGAGSYQETLTEGNSYRNGISISEKKDLMVVKDESLLFVQRACQPHVNRTESLRLVDELRGWVHRHEVISDKSRKGSKMLHKLRTLSKSVDKKTDVAHYVTRKYTDINEKNSGSELQVYYAPDKRYPSFFEAIRRRGDTFYLISFRRDHFLLPAISHNKTTRPKMSLVLPAMNIDDRLINEPKDHEVMMQIDCEVRATRILHIKTSSIPAFLRERQENHTDTYQRPAPTPTHAAPPIITESAQGTGVNMYQ